MMFNNEWKCLIALFITLHQLYLINLSHGLKVGHTNCSCGQEAELAGRILGGRILPRNGHPSLALITYKGDIACGATVVGPHHILTAAHCLEDVYSVPMLKVLLGVHDRIELATHVQTYDVKQVIKHEKYEILKRNIIVNDIALLKVNRIEFNEFVRPICLPFKMDVFRHKAAAVAGWGRTEYQGPLSRMPRATFLSLLTGKQCQKTKLNKPLSGVPNMYNMILCAYRRNSDACQGDSGGPLFVRDENFITFQIGIVSFGMKCGTPDTPGIYTKLTNYLQWLHAHLDGGYCSVPP